MITTVLVDDEPLARAGLRELLSAQADISIVGEAGDGDAAVDLIADSRPDLVFLDIQMPGRSGLDVVRAVSPRHLPAIVFVTAHDRFALEAFEVDALDYLLKPPSAERLHASLDRVRRELATDRPRAEALAGLLDRTEPGARAAGRLVIRDRGRYLLLPHEEIDWIGASGNYVELHSGDRSHLHRETMAALEARLDPGRFRRIHRSTLVNLDRIRSIAPDGAGDFQVTLTDGTTLRMSRRFRERVLK
ncbi:MAG TPA: LytTR family DNA-binding domain-containing protein [Candidatus Eisenbacteria bacterium]